MNEDQLEKLWKALESVFPELANGTKLMDLKVGWDPAKIFPEGMTQKFHIELEYGYDPRKKND